MGVRKAPFDVDCDAQLPQRYNCVQGGAVVPSTATLVGEKLHAQKH